MDYPPPPPAPIIQPAPPLAYPDDDLIVNPANGNTTWGDLFGRPTPPRVPQPPLTELQAHQAAQIKWGQEHGRLPVPPPPAPRVTFPPPPPQPALAPEANPTKRINVRQKGQRGEREVVDILQDIVSRVREVMRLEPIVLQRNALQAHLGGEDIHGLAGYSVEVKFQENTNVAAWWRQCVTQAEKAKGVPILFYRAKQQKWKVMFRAEVRTPKNADDIELDIQTDLESFKFWFECAYMENAIEEAQLLK